MSGFWIKQVILDIGASFCPGLVSGFGFFCNLIVVPGSAHEEHMKRKIIHPAEKKFISKDWAVNLRNQINLVF